MRQNNKLTRRIAVFTLALIAPLAGATVISYSTMLSGLAEEPANASPGSGIAMLTMDTTAHAMRVEASFTNLSGVVTAAHVHCCTPTPGAGNIGVATALPTFPGFPLGVTSGSYDQLFDLLLATSWNPSFVTAQGGLAGAESALLAGLTGGGAYFNIHTAQFPGGEIRGFLAPTQVPEPST
ncbi:MAG: CHRD domain-containing protein, partial [Propionivibrio sp.]